MPQKTRIDWLSDSETDALSWNPVHYKTAQNRPSWWCERVSPGCEYCLAERNARNWYGNSYPSVRDHKPGDRLYLDERVLKLPYSWQRTYRVLVCPMTDLFHPQFALWWSGIFQTMEYTPWHRYIVVTKRVGELATVDHALRDHWPENIMVCCSIESADFLWRLETLKKIRAWKKGVFLEPLLSQVDLRSRLAPGDIEWVVAGGEYFGPGERQLVHWQDGILQPKPEALQWVRDIRDQALDLGARFFFKGWGGNTLLASGRTLDGRTWDGIPA